MVVYITMEYHQRQETQFNAFSIQDIRHKRIIFLDRMRQYLMEGRLTDFTDETWVHLTQKFCIRTAITLPFAQNWH